MRRFVVNLLLFLAALTLTDLAFGMICDRMVARAKGGSNKQMNDLVMNDQCEVLILGSSRARHHYNPWIIADSLNMSCYNAGYDGNGIVLADGIFRLVSERYKPKVIVYDVTQSFDIYDYPADQKDTRYISDLKPYFRNPKIGEIIKDISNDEYIKVHSGLCRYNSKLITLLKENVIAVPIYEKGFAPLEGIMNYEPDKLEETAAGTIVDSLKLSYVEDFIQRVQANDVRLIFSISPRYKSTSRRMFEPVEDICRRYNVPVIDFYNDVTITSDRKYFKDVAHMNVEGANLFSMLFSHELKKVIKAL